MKLSLRTLSLALLAAATAKAEIAVQVVTSPEQAGAVNSTLLLNGDEVVVVDAQFTKSGAEAVVKAVKASGKKLTSIFITHAHPDHYLGTAVLAKAFPAAKVVATADVVSEMKTSALATAESREGMLGPEFPGVPVIPIPVKSLSVGGEAVTLLPGLAGDTHGITGIWLADSGTLIASDVGFADVHAWTATTDQAGRQKWAAQLDALAKRQGLKRVIPGHQLADSKHEVGILTATRDYALAFNAAATKSKSAKELIASMTKAYPKLRGALFLQLGAGAHFAKTTK